MIQVNNLTKNFGFIRALDDVSFTVDKGEIVGFLGPNGAGKTTAMRIIAGYLSPTEGTVTIDGVSVDEEPLALKTMIGYLPEHPPLYMEMYVRNYLEFVGSVKGVPRAGLREAVDEAMEAVMITDKAGMVIRHLSKGYRQRVGLAGALVHKPPILILDEPTVGLDPTQIVEIRKLISNLKAEDRTLIISTHILAEVEQTCEKVIIINRGRIVAIDSRENLTSDGSGQARLQLEVARKVDSALQALSGLEQVTATRMSGNLLAVSYPPGEDMREAISRVVLESGAGLLAMQPQKLGLEEVFINLTREQGLPGGEQA